jgi:CubicO group peptidase (beta-lactamase class C family)
VNKRILLFVLFSVNIACLTSFAQSQEYVEDRNYYPEKEWRISTPEQQGMDSQALLDMYKIFGNQGKIIIVRNSYLVTDYNQSYLQKDIHHIHSCTKSIISALIGNAIKDGYIKNINQNVLSFFPEYKNIKNLDERKKKLTLYHLLTMSSGMQWCDNPNINSNEMSNSPDWAQYVLDQPMIEEPGQVWNYNSGGSQLLSVIIQKTTGKSAQAYATEKIFKPLGITEVNWWKDQQGHSTAGWGLHLTSFDIAKIGYLFLQNGRWKDKQVISEYWVKESTKIQISVDSGFGSGSGYGYHWWVYTDLPFYAYKAWGSFGKHSVMIIVIPNLDMVVVLAGDNSADKRILKSFIIPSVKSSKPLSPNPEIVKELKKVIDMSSN